MPLKFRKMWARLILALVFFRHLAWRSLFFWKKSRGLERFFEHFNADAIGPVSDLEREKFPSYQRCINCSLCTISCTAVQKGTAPAGFQPKMIMLCFGRSAHESEVFLEEWLPCVQCGSCQVLCPNDVPVHGMVELILERRNRVGFRAGVPRPSRSY